MMPGNSTQVFICGAGPTGLSLAVQLVRYQVDFVIIDLKDGPTKLSKALVVQARTMEIFQETGLADKAKERGSLTRAANVYHKGNRKAHLNLGELGQGLSQFPFALSLEQSKTEELLLEYLEEHGKRVSWNTRLLRYDEDRNGLSIFYEDKDGVEQETEARMIVGCDGASSLVRHQMGAGFYGDTVPKIFYVADVILESSVIAAPELYMFLIRKGFVLFFPMAGKDHYRMIGIVPNKTDDEQLGFEEVQSHLTENLQVPVSISELRWFSTYKVHSRKASFFRKGNCFIAGDAAHIHTPAGGQGMNTGIQDAYNLAWKIAYTLRYQAHEGLLDSYATEREQNAKHLLETTDRLFDFMAGTHAFEDFIRLHAFPFLASLLSHSSVLNRNIFPLISQTNIAYPQSLLTIKSNIGKVKAGDRLPFFITEDGETVFDKINVPLFKLLYFGEEFPSQSFFTGDRARDFHIKKVPKDIFGNHSDFYIFLRPDNHIIYLGKDPSTCSALWKLLFSQA